MLVSVIIAAYNAQEYIEEALASVLRQTYPHVEAIVCDDHSTDKTVEIVKKQIAADPRIRLLVNDENMGPAYCRNRAIDASQGDWLAVLDADDCFRQDRIETMLSLATRHEADLVFDNLMYISSAGEKLGVALDAVRLASVFPCSALEFIKNDWRGTFSYGYLKPLISKHFLNTYDIRQRVRFKTGQDFVFTVESLLSGAHAIITTEPMYFYRQTFNSISRSISLERWDIFLESSVFLKTLSKNNGYQDCTEELDRRERYLKGAKAYNTVTSYLRNGQWGKAIFTVCKNVKYLRTMIRLFYGRICWRLNILAAGKYAARRMSS